MSTIPPSNNPGGAAGIAVTFGQHIQVRARAVGLYGATSAWSTTTDFYVDNPPNAPTLGTASTTATGSTMTLPWTFSDPDAGDAQTAYAVRAAVNGGPFRYWNAATAAWSQNEVQNQSTVGRAAVLIDQGGTWSWTVRTWDRANVPGPYATPGSFAATAPLVDGGNGTDLLAVVTSGSSWGSNPLPQVTGTTRRIYNRLPNVYPALDATAGAPPDDLPLLRYLALFGDQMGELETLLDRFGYDGPGTTSDLVDPNSADVAWLPWLAQLVGVRLPTPLGSVTAARALIANPAAGWRSVTKAAMASAAQSVLTGTKYVSVIDHPGGDPWTIEVRTRTSETPSFGGSFVWGTGVWGTMRWGVNPVIDAITGANAKPAGFRLIHTLYEATWDTVAGAYTTWDASAGHTWDQTMDTGRPPS